MKRLLILLLAAGLLGLLALRVVSSVRERSSYEAEQERPASVRIASVVRADFPQRIHVTGTIRARSHVDVFTKRGGRLLEVRVDVGDSVRKGDLLALIEHEEASWQARQADAAVAVAKAGVAGARLEFERTESLFEAGSVPQAALDGARVQLELAQAQLAQAEAASGLAHALVDHARVRAPISGVITRRNAEPGAMAGTQMPLFAIQDTGALELQTTVDAASLVLLEKGQTARVWSDDAPGKLFAATVTRLAPSLDSATRRGEVVLSLEPSAAEGSPRLVPNAFARAEILVGSSAAALAVPRSAVVEGTGGSRSVFRFDDGVARQLPVNLRGSHDGLVAVLVDGDGLEEGDSVLIHGHSRLVDGAVVRLASETDAVDASVRSE